MTDMIPLAGARLVRSSKPTAEELEIEQSIKVLTSGNPTEIKNLHSDFTEVDDPVRRVIGADYPDAIVPLKREGNND